jgi:hypothetical protein
LFFAAGGHVRQTEAQETQRAVTTPPEAPAAPAPQDLQTQLDELRSALEQARTNNASLKQELDQREAVIRLLTENLAIARTESELFQKRWQDAQLRAQTLGVNFADPTGTQAQRQLVESVRALYVAEAERQRLAEELLRLLAALQTNGNVAAEIVRARDVLAAGEQPMAGRAPTDARQKQPTLESAQVLDVNPSLRLVVLNVGLLHGARVGMPFVVLRGDRAVAALKVVEVRRRICGALIETTEKGVTLTTNDVVRVTKS